MATKSKKLRFQTYFGVPVPPFKEDLMGAGTSTIRFIITKNIISKKNNQQAIAVRKDAVSFLYELQKKNGRITLDDALKAVKMVRGKMRGNAQYQEFLKRMKPVMQKQMDVWTTRFREKYGDDFIMFPLPKASLNIRLYIKDRYRRDTVNAQQTIQDLLVDAKVIDDDDDSHLNPVYGASARYYEELVHNIAFISLSFRPDPERRVKNEVEENDMAKDVV
jgi:hypothetical protein